MTDARRTDAPNIRLPGRVFVLHRAMVVTAAGPQDKHDLSEAETFGQLVTVFMGSEVNKADPSKMMDRLATMLADFDRDDSILCIGDPVVLFMAGLVLSRLKANAGFREIRLLRWDRFKRTYDQQMIPMPNWGLTRDLALG